MASSRGRKVPKAPVDNVQVTAAETYLNSWITRYNDVPFKCNGIYHGVVEVILSKGAAVVVVGMKERGIPLLWDDDWNSKGLKFARVLLLVDHLRPSIEQPEYDKDTIIREKIKVGEVLSLVIEESKPSPDNVFKYFATSAFKSEAADKHLDESVMLNIQDPLRGVVDSYVSQDIGIIRFGTYRGVIAKALFMPSCYESNSSSGREKSSLSDLAPVYTKVYIEVMKWHPKTVVQKWEKLLQRDGILFKAKLVWPQDSSRPNRRGGKEGKANETQAFAHERREYGCKGSVEQLPSLFDSNAVMDLKINYLLTDRHAYYGVIEIIPSVTVAVVCTAHRKGEPLSWKDNWLVKGVSLERILLISDHVRMSIDTSECAKGTPIKSVLQKGDRVMVVVEPTAKGPDKCYKWFAKTCWKVVVEEGEFPSVPLKSLRGHLTGEVESIITHDMGIISFKTYHGHVVRGFFSHKSYYKSGRKILSHIPLGSEVKVGTRVYLFADKWHSGKKPKELEQNVHGKEVNYRVVMAWEIGTSRPDESDTVENKTDVKTSVNQKMRRESDRNETYPSSAAHEGQSKSSEFKVPAHRSTWFPLNQRMRMRAGLKVSKNQHRSDDSKSCGDSLDFADSLSELEDFLGASTISTENLSEASSSQSETQFPLRDQMSYSKNDNTMDARIDSSLKYPVGLSVSSSQFKNEVPNLDGTKTGTLMSIDESWGLLQVDGLDEALDFQSDAVYMYGLKLDDVPLHKVFHEGQILRVHLEEGKITAVEYGAPQLPHLMRKAITIYCKNNVVSEDVKNKLESIMHYYGV
ncbi:uncharacterized protein [Hetaerina americana]|uniref:uncharacterized protein n=1 Tax=Hetaerina americana TaxID=62018 RepID=UPI003A7F16B8